ncbi:amidohydrolase family protein [Actinomadura barringtoniae]|uniref:Amidohydrolase family protein n=1 Tax=Actinomadura barringtoniae TaxID=1427535 RepID=A0A939PE03_9ACTN|nr:amidohydrolase family protein [Actinomadura barringtoniae]MBO2447499.1 amidohydrolase family protein [Actinomadura barringtoniae]
MSIVIRNVTAWSQGTWLPGQDVHVEAGRVRAVVPHESLPVTGEVLDGSGGHLIPGLVNTHTHLHQSIMRGIAEGEPLIRWLRYVAEGTVALTPEQAYVAAAVASLEALRSGTTALVEHMWPHPSREVHDAVLRALDDTGIRAVVCRGVADRPDTTRKWGFDQRLMEPLDAVFAHVDELAARTAGGRIQLGLAVPNPRSLTPEGMTRVRAFAEERGMTTSIHLLETATDEDMCREHTGLGAVDFLERSGFLWDRLLAVHCCKLDEAGRRRLAERGVAVSYNPLSNMRLGSGVAPVPEMLEAGIRVGLGVDGAASNDTQDALETMRMGAYLQRAVHGRSDLLGFPDMVRLATTGANGVVGLEDRPEGLVPGIQADLVLLRFDRDLGCVPVLDPGATLLTTGSNRTVDTVLVDGEVLISDGRSTRLDEKELIARAVAAAPEIACNPFENSGS